ncbi:MAG: hypothetical protein P1V20_28835, partial [Verrucomicrobiales bacterium]|nr:hypothetical protein [Verrucomicrobiales bacterium]
AHLEQNPEDWDTRCTIAQAYYDAEHYTEAAHVISDAPEIPFDEDNVLFAATLIGSADPEAGHGLLDQFIDASPSENAYELKAQLYEMAGDSDSAAACRASIPSEPVAVVLIDEPEPDPKPAEPQPLRPPGSENEEAEDELVEARPARKGALPPGALVMSDSTGHPVELNMELSQPVPLNLEQPAEPAHLSYTQSHTIERSFVVGDGEAVHGVAPPPPTNERLGAITAAIIVHVIIALLLLAAKVASPRPNPPQITASSVPITDEASLESTTLT